jgi:hypothetical protein
MTIYSDALGKQSTFNTNLIAKLQELATAVGNRVRSADLYDGNGKIKSNLLPFAINDLLEMKGALTLQSYQNQITSGSGTKDGEIYIVTEAATGLAIDANRKPNRLQKGTSKRMPVPGIPVSL